MKLDRFLAKQSSMGRTEAHRMIAQRRVRVDGLVITDGQHEVDRFMGIELGDTLLQRPERALYLMLHKPLGYLSATVDAQHPTVLELIDDPDKHTLHIAGRLDRNTSGLLLLTNDGRWSKQLMDPGAKVPKTYLVETQQPIPAMAVEAFAQGLYFHTEDITTLPAELVILDDCRARLTLHEGRYHQVKRMFHRVGTRVAALHRESIGGISLPSELCAGQWRALSLAELGAAAAAG